MRKVLAALLSALLFTVIPVRAQTDAEQVINIGRNVLSMDDYMLAIQYFNQAIKAKPYLAEPYYLRAYAKLLLDDYEGAEKDCSLAIERNKFLVDTYRLRAFARQNLGLDSLAILDYDVCLQNYPEEQAFLFNKAIAQARIEHYEEADSTLTRLIRIYPKNDEAYAARGQLHLMNNDTVAALADIDKAIELSDKHQQPFLLKADIEINRKNWPEALKAMDHVIEFQPHDAFLYLNRAFIRYNLDDFFGAMSDYNKTIELDPANNYALFNRALLRYEVKDLIRAALDFEELQRREPNNFHVAYNLGLIEYEQGKYSAAIKQFQNVTKKFPRFFPAFYAIADCYQKLGNTRAAVENVLKAEGLIKAYVNDPKKNRLYRPPIESGISYDVDRKYDDKDDVDVMSRYNQLITAGRVSDTQISFNDKIKGRVQDRDINVDIEPIYYISLIDSPSSLKITSNFFPELDDFNNRKYVGQKLFFIPAAELSEEEYQSLFDLAGKFQETADISSRAADWLILGISRTMLKDSEAAVKALSRAIELYPDFALAYVERAYAHQISGDRHQTGFALADYDSALKINPRLSYAWFNKGCIYYGLGDFPTALDCFNRALEIDPSFANAYYNRGITYLQMGEKQPAFTDLSKAGELGVLQSYNLLKRMK